MPKSPTSHSDIEQCKSIPIKLSVTPLHPQDAKLCGSSLGDRGCWKFSASRSEVTEKGDMREYGPCCQAQSSGDSYITALCVSPLCPAGFTRPDTLFRNTCGCFKSSPVAVLPHFSPSMDTTYDIYTQYQSKIGTHLLIQGFFFIFTIFSIVE